MDRFEQWAERRWRTVRDLTVTMMHGCILRISTEQGMVTAGRGQVFDWRTTRSGELSASGLPDAEIAIRLTAEFDLSRLRRAMRSAKERA